MPRFYVSPDSIRDGRFSLSESESHHAIHVLRKKPGDTIDVFDGKDGSWIAEIDSITGGVVQGRFIQEAGHAKSPLRVVIFQALLRGSKWDWMLEKLCEVGVEEVVPVLTARTLVRWKEKEDASKVERWNRIALAASKQSGRSHIMQVASPCSLGEAIQKTSTLSLTLVASEKEKEKSMQAAWPSTAPSSVGIFIGPEGGWEPREIEELIRAGAISVKLGHTLLRTETAGLVAAVLSLHQAGVY